VPPDAPEAMAAAIVALLQDRALAAAHAAAARARFEQQFTLTRMIDRVVELYAEVVA
jgi:glycosyltransferase involved in cell wall biosynthesis